MNLLTDIIFFPFNINRLGVAAPKIKYVEKLPLEGGYNAQTLPPFGIYILKKHLNNEALLEHELVHWRQYQRMGLVQYYLQHLIELAVKGYDRSSLEIEARKNEQPFCQTNYTFCVRNGLAATLYDPSFRIKE